VLQPFWRSKPHIYSVHRFEVPDKKSALAELKPSVPGRYIRVVHQQNRAFFAADVGLLPVDLVFSARLTVLADDNQLGSLFGARLGAELKARPERKG
jgi:hypothetical protein